MISRAEAFPGPARAAGAGEGARRPSSLPPPAPPLLPLLLAGSVAASGGVAFVAQLAALLVPDHWCRDAVADSLKIQLPLDDSEVLQFTAPPAPPGISGFSYSQCERFDGDMAAAYVKWIMKRYKPHFTNISQSTIACDQGWHYNTTGGFPTISTELNWVCSDYWKPYAIHFTFFISASLGVFLWSAIARRCGRTRALMGALCVGAAGAAASLLPLGGLAHVLVARAAAGSPFLAAPHLALLLIATGEIRSGGVRWRSAQSRSRWRRWRRPVQRSCCPGGG